MVQPQSQVVDCLTAAKMLAVWKQHGHNPLDAIKAFVEEDGTVMVGILDFSQKAVMLIPEHMNRPYRSFAHAFTDIGAVYDEMFRLDAHNTP